MPSVDFAIGDGVTTQFILPYGWQAGSTPVFNRRDWQGLQLLYNTSRTNIAQNSNYIGNVGNWAALDGYFVPRYAIGPMGGFTAALLNLTNGSGTNGADLYYSHLAVTSGLTYTVSLDVMMQSALVFDLVVNDTFAWNTVGGAQFTSANGLNTNTFTRISFTFVAPTTNLINIHLGANKQTGVAQQTPGMVFVDNIQVELGSVATSRIITAGAPASVTDYSLTGRVLSVSPAPGVGAVLNYNYSPLPWNLCQRTASRMYMPIIGA